MFTDFYQKNKRLVQVSVIAILVLLVGWAIFYNLFLFHITSITPNPTKASYLSPRLVVEFNKNLSSDNIKVTVNNGDLVTAVDGKKLTITLPGDLAGNKTYNIDINSISSKNGDTIKDHVIALQTVLNSDSLTDEDRQLILDQQQSHKSPIINDPILSYLPYGTLDFTIDGVINNADTDFEKITVQITLLLTAADVRIDRDAAIQQYQDEAMNYLKSLKGVNLDNYNVEVSVDDPTL